MKKYSKKCFFSFLAIIILFKNSIFAQDNDLTNSKNLEEIKYYPTLIQIENGFNIIGNEKQQFILNIDEYIFDNITEQEFQNFILKITNFLQDFELDKTYSNSVSRNFTYNIEKKGEYLLFPIREVFEDLGYTVDYQPINKVITIHKDDIYLTFTIGEDFYLFEKMITKQLGQAPIIKDGISYAPIEVLTEILQIDNVRLEKGLVIRFEYGINLLDKSDYVENLIQNVIPFLADDFLDQILQIENVSIEEFLIIDESYYDTEQSVEVEIVSIDKQNNQILINDENKGEVILNISPDVEIFYNNQDSTLQHLFNLAPGDKLRVVYNNAMTMSLPPINNVIKIIVLK